MLHLYKAITTLSRPFLGHLLQRRLRRGKEDQARLGERMGQSRTLRPQGILFWVHAASVGEAQSALILIQRLLAHPAQPHILITTGTTTSARFLAGKLPDRCIHQYYPLDHPAWVNRFLDHWKPDHCFWMESELWPNMLGALKKRQIPAALVNARMSPRSFKRWNTFRHIAKDLLQCFDIILAQTEQEAGYYTQLGAQNVVVTGNLKYSADPLPYNAQTHDAFITATGKRPLWLYASTHKGEEELACAMHKALKAQFNDILTIIVPRHPERGESIAALIHNEGLAVDQRSEGKESPASSADIYLADTIGELGLFYSIAPIACIGRSFSDDGGGGHNPIEAAQLGCAVLHGPHIQNLGEIFSDMDRANAALEIPSKNELAQTLLHLLSNPQALADQQAAALDFAQSRGRVIERVMDALDPGLANIPVTVTE